MEVFLSVLGYGLLGLVLLGGLVLSIVLWRRAPRSAGLAVGAAVLAILGVLLTVIWVIMAPRLAYSRGYSSAWLAPFQLGVNLLSALFSIGAAGLLVGAIFSGRGRAAPRGPR